MIRVAHEAREVRVREFLRLDEMMEIRRRVEAHRLEIVRIENAQHLERGDSLIVRRQLPHAIALERRRDGRNPRRLILLQIVDSEKATELLNARDELLAERAAVER